jgi:hypothetical protein
MKKTVVPFRRTKRRLDYSYFTFNCVLNSVQQQAVAGLSEGFEEGKVVTE